MKKFGQRVGNAGKWDDPEAASIRKHAAVSQFLAKHIFFFIVGIYIANYFAIWMLFKTSEWEIINRKIFSMRGFRFWN